MVYVSLKKIETQEGRVECVLVSDAVNLEQLGPLEFKEQLRKRFMTADAQNLATATVGSEWLAEGPEAGQTQWQKRAAQWETQTLK